MLSEKKLSEKVVYDAISDSLMSLRLFARILLKRRWGKMTSTEKFEAGRALAVLNIISANPKQYFSSCHEDVVVRKKAAQNVDNNTAKNDFLAKIAQEDSAMTLFGQIVPLYFFNKNFADTCRNVCLRIYMWEKYRFSAEPKDRDVADMYARNIVNFSQVLKQAAHKHASYPFMDRLRKFVYNLFQK